MAIEYFLKLDGLQGESLSSKHPNEIELHVLELGGEQSHHRLRQRFERRKGFDVRHQHYQAGG